MLEINVDNQTLPLSLCDLWQMVRDGTISLGSWEDLSEIIQKICPEKYPKPSINILITVVANAMSIQICICNENHFYSV